MGDKKQLFNKFMDAEYEYNYVYPNMFGLVSSNVFGLVSRTYDFRGNVDDKCFNINRFVTNIMKSSRL